MIQPALYSVGGNILGHYRVAQRSGEIAATLGAAAHLARIRWAPGSATPFFYLKRVRVGISFSGAVTTAVEMTMRLIKVTQFTVDFTTNMTAINMSTGKSTNSDCPDVMTPSTMGANGPGICTTAAMSGQTMTADNAPFAITPIPTLIPVTATGTAVAVPVGTCSAMAELYSWSGNGDFPIKLGNNEGIIVQNHLAGPASGTFALYVQWEWFECPIQLF